MWRRGIRLLTRGDNTCIFYVNNGGVSIRVCKTAFLRIHGISNGRLSWALSAALKGGTPHQDQRGHHEPKNKTDTTRLNIIDAHIESFPQYTSHYSRHDNPHRRYLSPELSITKMYELYREFCTGSGYTPVTEWVYQKQFNENHNLSFGRLVAMYNTITLTLIFWLVWLCTVLLYSHSYSLTL